MDSWLTGDGSGEVEELSFFPWGDPCWGVRDCCSLSKDRAPNENSRLSRLVVVSEVESLLVLVERDELTVL